MRGRNKIYDYRKCIFRCEFLFFLIAVNFTIRICAGNTAKGDHGWGQFLLCLKVNIEAKHPGAVLLLLQNRKWECPPPPLPPIWYIKTVHAWHNTSCNAAIDAEYYWINTGQYWWKRSDTCKWFRAGKSCASGCCETWCCGFWFCCIVATYILYIYICCRHKWMKQ